MQGKNTAIQVQEALVKAASGYKGSIDLARVLKDAETEIGIAVNEKWAIEALESKGFIVEDQSNRRIVRRADRPIAPPNTWHN
jgi:hypothetical protein